MRILIVQETDWLSRNVIHQHHLAERLAKAGHELRIIDYDIMWHHKDLPRVVPRQEFNDVTRVVDGVSLQVIRPAAVNVTLLCHANWAIMSLVELRRLYKQWPFDVVVGLSLTNSYLMAQLLKRMDIPYVSMVLEPYHTMMSQKWAQFPARIVERLAMGEAERVVVFTPGMETYAQQMGVANERIVCLKTGVNLDVFHPEVDGSEQRAKLDIEAGERVLFFMGWLYEFSGLRQIAAAIERQAGLPDGVRLLIVGDGPLLTELRDFIELHGLHDRIILTGRRPYEEIPQYLAAADVCLLPSLLNETTQDIVPMKVYEYLAAGNPVVASDLPGLKAEFGSGSGILYGESPQEVLQISLDLVENPQQIKQLGRIGRQYAEQNADWQNTTREFEALLASVLGISLAKEPYE